MKNDQAKFSLAYLTGAAMTCLSMLQMLCFLSVTNLMLWFTGITYLTIIKKIISAVVLRYISNRLGIAGTL